MQGLRQARTRDAGRRPFLVVNTSAWYVPDFPTSPTNPVTELDLLEVEKEPLVQEAYILKDSPADHQCGSGNPIATVGCVARWDAQGPCPELSVKESKPDGGQELAEWGGAPGTREDPGTSTTVECCPGDAGPRVSLKVLHESGDSSRFDNCVRIEQEKVADARIPACDQPNCSVVSCGESAISRRWNHGDSTSPVSG